MDTDADKRSQSLTPVDKPVDGVRDPSMPIVGVHEMAENHPSPIELPLNETRSELGSDVRSETERRKWVDDRAAAGYDGAYRGN